MRTVSVRSKLATALGALALFGLLAAAPMGHARAAPLNQPPDPVVELMQTGPNSTDSELGDVLVFRVRAFDRRVGTNDGDGIESVDMSIIDENDREVARLRDKRSGYCLFGDGEPECEAWDFDEHDNRWPSGERVRSDGEYRLRTRLNLSSGESTETVVVASVTFPGIDAGALQGLVVELMQTGRSGQSSEVEDALVFRVRAFDPQVGSRDGDGIESVTLIVVDSNDEEVARLRDERAGYCVFGGGEDECDAWDFSEHNNRWPNGDPVRTDEEYRLRAQVDADSGAGDEFELGAVRIRLGNTAPPSAPSGSWQGYKTLIGDVNGDGTTDLIWNRTAERNRIAVGLSNGDGTFRFTSAQQTGGTGWQAFKTLTDDVNGDGRADLIWNETSNKNRIYVGLSNGDGSFAVVGPQDAPGSGWQAFKTLSGDINGDGRADLIWNETTNKNRTYVGLSNGDGTFRILPFQDRTETGWSAYQTLVGDVNGDGRADLIWNRTGDDRNRVYVGLSQGDGTLQFLPFQDRSESGWANYETLVGDVNGDGRSDLVWNRVGSDRSRIYLGLSNGDGTFAFQSFQDRTDTDWQGYRVLADDFNGDGRTDLVWNLTSAINRTYVGLVGTDRVFRLTGPQQRAETGWQLFDVFTGDVNGDGRSDLIWNETSDKNRIYVALSVGDGALIFRPFQDHP